MITKLSFSEVELLLNNTLSCLELLSVAKSTFSNLLVLLGLTRPLMMTVNDLFWMRKKALRTEILLNHLVNVPEELSQWGFTKDFPRCSEYSFGLLFSPSVKKPIKSLGNSIRNKALSAVRAPMSEKKDVRVQNEALIIYCSQEFKMISSNALRWWETETIWAPSDQTVSLKPSALRNNWEIFLRRKYHLA